MNSTEFQTFAPRALQAPWLSELLTTVESSAREQLLAEGFTAHADVDETLAADGRWVRRLFGLTVTGPDNLAMDVVARLNLRYLDGNQKPGCWLRLSARTYPQQLAEGEFLPGWNLLDWTVHQAPLELADMSFGQADDALFTAMDAGLGATPGPELRELTQEFCRQALEALTP